MIRRSNALWFTHLTIASVIMLASSVNGSWASEKVKYKNFRWDYQTWQGFSIATIRNSRYQLEFVCDHAESSQYIKISKRLNGQGDTAPLFPKKQVMITIAGNGRSAMFEMDDGDAVPIGTMGMRALAEAADIMSSSKEFSVEIPDLDFQTRFSTRDAKDSIKGVYEDCMTLQ